MASMVWSGPWATSHSVSLGHRGRTHQHRLRGLPGFESGVLPEQGAGGGTRWPCFYQRHSSCYPHTPQRMPWAVATTLGWGPGLPHMQPLFTPAGSTRWGKADRACAEGRVASREAATGHVSHGAEAWTVGATGSSAGSHPDPGPDCPITSSRSSSGVHGVWSVLSVW